MKISNNNNNNMNASNYPPKNLNNIFDQNINRQKYSYSENKENLCNNNFNNNQQHIYFTDTKTQEILIKTKIEKNAKYQL